VKKILILGGTGLLGSYLVNYFKGFSEIYYSYNSQTVVDSNVKNSFFLNALDHKSVESYIRDIAPDILINAIALANVDNVQVEKELGYELNVRLPVFLNEMSIKHDYKLVHISTDHFSGDSPGFIKENDSVFSLNCYGEQKLEAEKSLLSLPSTAIIVRTNFFRHDFYSKRGLMEWVIYKLNNNQPFNGFTNVHFTPVSCEILSRGILRLLDIEYSGLIHISSSEDITKYDFARFIANSLKANSNLINPCDFEERPDFVTRPTNMCLDNSNFIEITGIKIPSIADMIEKEIRSRDNIK
jgi:dTDP-4-dehydrorhamnose reductase